MELGWLLRGWRTGIVTTPYPTRPDPPPQGFRGRPQLDGERCRIDDGCTVCVEVCLPRALRLETVPNGLDRRLVLDLLPCIMCGLCVQACPTGALHMQSDGELAVRSPQDAQTIVPLEMEVSSDGHI
ncbi:MAG: 4Fe-4S dicluster domain-containing protein [Chloroflexi bacterium]|nr:4Fe-4S dicluster domain-containing protein [Chloroflexota bacterium]